MKYFAAPLFAFALITLVSAAHAEDAPPVPASAPPAAEAGPDAAPPAHEGKGGGKHMMFMDPAEMDKIDAMSEDDRKAYFDQKKADWEKLTPEQREVKKAEMKAKFDALSPEQKAAIKEKMEKRKEAFKQKMKEKWEKMTPEEKADRIKKNKEWFDSLPAEDQERIKHKWNKKRGEQGEGKFGGKIRERLQERGGEAPAPAAD